MKQSPRKRRCSIGLIAGYDLSIETATVSRAEYCSFAHMNKLEPYHAKFARIRSQTSFDRLPEEQREFLRTQSFEYRFSQQELRQLCEIGVDLNQWGEESIIGVWPLAPEPGLPPKERRAEIVEALCRHADLLRSTPKQFGIPVEASGSGQYRIRSGQKEREHLGLGYCPVASERTRCCSLLTLDAVENCGFGCSYCSIQSFYHDDEIHFDSSFADKLQALELDPEKIYHIGTGQSSDSMMWGNRFGVLGALMDFARRNPNVILELKSKSKNIAYLLKNQIPIRTFSGWDESKPGFVEIDLVGHEGGIAQGEFAFTLNLTDVQSGWTEPRAIKNKAQKWTFEALMHIKERIP